MGHEASALALGLYRLGRALAHAGGAAAGRMIGAKARRVFDDVGGGLTHACGVIGPVSANVGLLALGADLDALARSAKAVRLTARTVWVFGHGADTVGVVRAAGGAHAFVGRFARAERLERLAQPRIGARRFDALRSHAGDARLEMATGDRHALTIDRDADLARRRDDAVALLRKRGRAHREEKNDRKISQECHFEELYTGPKSI